MKKNYEKKTKPVLLVEPGSTGSVIRCVPDRTTRVHVLNGMLNRYKEKKIISTDLGKISSNFSASLCVQNVFYLVRWLTL